PTSGFKVSVDNMVLEEKDGKSTLVVYANFQDPDKKTAFSQIITYPIQVVKTNLNALPDNIELRIQY
ncbi:MAG: protease complex subunit PrcB family protein, partial [Anaerovoracaceae bacterium]